MVAQDQDRFVTLVAAMNDVAASSGGWVGVLELMQGLLGVKASSIEVFDKSSGELHFLAAAPVDPAEQRLYEEHIHKLNPRYALLPGLRVGEIRTDRHVPPESDAGAGAYYEWLQRAAGTRYFAGVKLIDTRDYLGLSSIHVPKDHGLIGAATQALYERLIPHLANALAVHQALAQRGVGAIDESLSSDRAYALLDREGRILECSSEFESVVERSGAIAIRRRRLVPLNGSDGARLALLVGCATSPDAPDAPLAPVRFERPDGRHGLLLRAARLSRSREMFARLRPVAMLVLVDLDAPSAGAAEALRAAWGLTPREAQLAVLIGEGRRLDQAAALLGMSEQTARSHLKGVFRRMGIERQTELVRVVTRLGA